MTIQKTTEFIAGIPQSSADQFPPGAVLLGRYRLAAAIGRGGMGIVYRADDLKLGQRVALKFLSPQLEHDPHRVQRLIAEVRLGRRVAHPNVCRIYDIAEVGSRHFISMELVEGEDLGSLLDRIRRLPQDKALSIARDVCAGLAAAHDQGVIHRDLKPGNVMIDGRGRARITDFGLAATVDDTPQRRVIAGTLGYMAPEQARGEGATPATDVYAFGVLLYEMITGRLPHEVSSPFELPTESPMPPSYYAPDLDPRIETLISKCLSQNPEERPRHARAVLEALPLPDVLDAAMEAGETPPPEVVAAAGAPGGMSQPVAWALIIATIALTMVSVWMLSRAPAGRLLTELRSPEEMRQRAIALADRIAPGRERELREWWGYEPQPRPDVWSPQTAMRFWYRRGAAAPFQRSITFDDPPYNDLGDVSIEIDGGGQLRRFRYIARGTERTSATTRDLFAEAGFDQRQFVPIETPPIALPPIPADHIEAWMARGASTVVIAGTNKGAPVFFEVRKDAKPAELPEADLPVILFIGALIFVAIGAAFLARRNLNRGRGDARGASRVALFVGVTWIASWVLITSIDKIMEGIAYSVLTAILVWLAYVALEPYVRRRWPRTLVSWNRLLQGRFLDPLVGRDLLIGIFAAAVLRVLLSLAADIAKEDEPHTALVHPLGLRLLGEHLYNPWLAVIHTFAFLFLLYAVTPIVRNRLVALILVSALLFAIFVPAGGTVVIGFVGLLVMIHRFGLLAGLATCYGIILQAEIKTFDFARWYGPSSVIAITITCAIVVWSLFALLPNRRARLH